MRILPALIVMLHLTVALACSGSQGGNDAPGNLPDGQTGQTHPSDTENTPERVATVSLVTLRKLTTERTYRDLGFQSVGEAERTSLGPPLQVFVVRLDQLREFAQSDDPRRLLTDVKRYVFPVLVDGVTRSAVTVELLNGKWEAVGFGGAVIAIEYAKVREMKTASGAGQFIAVQIPAMQLNFLGHGAGESALVLTPLPSNTDADVGTRMFHNDTSIIGFKAKDAQGNSVASELYISPEYRSVSTDEKASDIFAKLAPIAKKIKDDVPR